jgi:glyoxylase-like metal-dependent hydrolase (beta-lactamase superfamily II)
MPLDMLGEVAAFGSNAYAVRYLNYVSTFFVTGEGVILVDPSGQVTPSMPQLVDAAIKIVTDQPVKYVIYSHWGADHATGGALHGAAQFVAHRNAIAKVQAAADPLSPVPGLVVDAPTTLSLGDTRIDLYPTEFSAVDDYLIVHERSSRVVITVDFVQAKTIPVGRLLGLPMRIIDRLQWIDETLDFEYVVSGHALSTLSGTRQDVRETRQYYVDLGDAMARAHGDPSGARALLEPVYGGWRRFDRMIDANIQGFIEWSARPSDGPSTRLRT